MTTPILHWGDEIEPGSKPTFIFPMLIQSLHVDLTMKDPTGTISDLILSESGFISATFPATGTGIHLIGSVAIAAGEGGPLDAADYAGSLTGINMRYSGVGTISGRAIGDPIPTEQAIGGQLANLTVGFSKDGAGLIPGIGVLAEIGGGLYKYTLDTTETQQPGSGLIRITPNNPISGNGWINTTYLTYRITKPGIPITQPAPGSTTIIDPQTLNELKKFLQQQTSTILNAMQTKPTFKRDA